MKKQLLLVDGSNLLFQMFYGMPARIVNRGGKAIQGTLGFVGALLKIIRMVGPTHVAVLFDGECQNDRKNLYPAYKANRTDYSEMPEEETPFSQLPDVYAALDEMDIRHAETTDCEADDWIAGYVRATDEDTEIVISSFDSDFFQLISDRVCVLRYRGKSTQICTPAYIRDKLGIGPSQYAAYKALTGDAADNIRGAEKVGPKTAAALLGRFGTLKGILQNAQAIAKPSVRESVMACRERLLTNLRLIRLDGRAALPFTMDELAFADRGAATREVLARIGLI